MQASLDKFTRLLKDKIGLESSTVGRATIEKTLNQRMRFNKLDNLQDYYQLVINDPDELNELLEYSVIPESWFFREPRPFEVIYSHIKTKPEKNTHYKILSIPCSTGEEPYSLAMYLIDRGLDPCDFSIDAIDISLRAIEFATQGVYSDNSFRHKEYNHLQKKFFDMNDGVYVIRENIKNTTHFRQQNVLYDNTQAADKYDFILCRNLLIYFDLPTKKTAFKSLANLLKKNGLLFIGHSEFGSVPVEIFNNLGSKYAFALCKLENTSHTNNTPTVNLNRLIQTQSHTLKHTPAKTRTNNDTNNDKNRLTTEKTKEPTGKPVAGTDKKQLLNQAREHADANRLSEAETLCQQHIKTEGESAEAYFILGLIASSKKHENLAESMFRKALFLQPKHFQALSHLSLLLQLQGDTRNAELFRQRANRVIPSDTSGETD